MIIYQDILMILRTHFFGWAEAGTPEELCCIMVAMFATVAVFCVPFLCIWWCLKKVLSAFGGL